MKGFWGPSSSSSGGVGGGAGGGGGLSFWRGSRTGPETHYPRTHDEVVEILKQARDNATCIRVTGGSFPFTALPDDVVVDLRHADRLLGLDVYQQTVTVESGMRLSVLGKILETVSLSLDVYGRVPDLTVCDALAVGAFGGSAVLMSSVCSCEVALASGKTARWTWEKQASEMRALCCGLGSAAVLLSATFRCVPLQRYTEISYLCSIRDVLEQWSIQVKASFSQQLLWYPFSELTVMTHLNPTDKYHMSKQPFLNQVLERVGEFCSRAVRRLSLLLSAISPPPIAHASCFYHRPSTSLASPTAGSSPSVGGMGSTTTLLGPMRNSPSNSPSLLSSLLARVQFFTQWSVAKQRSDFVHSLPRPWNPQEACRGASWLIPLDRLPEVLCSVSQWARRNPSAPVAPLHVQTLKMERRMQKRPFLAPFKDGPSCAVWYDWFVPESNPDPLSVSSFEDIFHSVGGRRAWSGADRLTSPLVLADSFERYPHWCRIKKRLDPDNRLQSAYIQGTVWSETGHSVEFGSTLSLCSSIMDAPETN